MGPPGWALCSGVPPRPEPVNVTAPGRRRTRPGCPPTPIAAKV